MMCDLKVRFTQSPERRDVFEYALRAEVVSAEGISPKIFVYHQMPKGLDGNTFAEFDHVATSVDMQEIPEDAATDIVPWYRTNKVTVWLRNASDLDTAKQLLVNDISWLQKAYNHLSSENDFTVQETVDFHGEGEYTHPSKEEEDSMSRRIDKIEEELKNKVDKDVLSGVDIAANTADGMRESIGVMGNVLGATVRSLSAFLCLSCLTAFGAGVYTAEYNTLDLDTHPSIVTNVTFDGLAMSSNTYTKAETDAKIVELATDVADTVTSNAISTNNPDFVSAVLAAPLTGADPSDLAEIGEYGSYGTVGAAILSLIAGLAALKRRIGTAETAITGKADAADLRYRVAEAGYAVAMPYTLPLDVFPITYTLSGNSYTISSNSGLVFQDDQDDFILVASSGTGHHVCAFNKSDGILNEAATQAYTDAAASLSFAGEPYSSNIKLNRYRALADRAVNLITATDETSIDIELPAAQSGRVRDFYVCFDNTAQGASNITMSAQSATLKDASGNSATLTATAGKVTTWRFTELKSATTSPAADPVFLVTGANEAQALAAKENASNKVTTLSAQSTDAQYPSAKCVYDLVGDIETALATINNGSAT